MIDRDILKEYGQRCYTAFEDPSHALTELRSYYREKIKRVGIEEIIKVYLPCPTPGYRIEGFKENQIELANAILKAIDKEMR